MSRINASRLVESVMCQYLGRSRASALVGDFLEEAADCRHSGLRFATRAGWFLAPFVARSALAYGLAAYAFHLLLPNGSMHEGPGVTLLAADAASTCGFMAIVLAVFGLVRFGARAPVTLLSLGLGIGVLAACWRLPANWPSLVSSVVVLSVVVCAAFRSRSGKRTLLILGHVSQARKGSLWLADPSDCFFIRATKTQRPSLFISRTP